MNECTPAPSVKEAHGEFDKAMAFHEQKQREALAALKLIADTLWQNNISRRKRLTLTEQTDIWRDMVAAIAKAEGRS